MAAQAPLEDWAVGEMLRVMEREREREIRGCDAQRRDAGVYGRHRCSWFAAIAAGEEKPSRKRGVDDRWKKLNPRRVFFFFFLGSFLILLLILLLFVFFFFSLFTHFN